jgi:hypothetical protein
MTAGPMDAADSAGTLSLINLGPLLGVFHLDFLATLLGLPLKTVKRVHRLASLAAFALAVFHVVIVVQTREIYCPNLRAPPRGGGRQPR